MIRSMLSMKSLKIYPQHPLYYQKKKVRTAEKYWAQNASFAIFYNLLTKHVSLRQDTYINARRSSSKFVVKRVGSKLKLNGSIFFRGIIYIHSQTSVHERLGSWTIRFTNTFSEHKASRMTYCVSSYEHASRQHRGAISWEYQRRQYS
jgi:hypothetical protein